MRRGFWCGLAVDLLLSLMLSGAGEQVAGAQVATTTVQDTVYLANGTTATGTVVVSWDSFTTAAGTAIAAGSLSAPIGAGGVVSLALAPNEGAMPSGSFYTAVYHLSDGSTSTEYWAVPSAAAGVPVSLSTVRSDVLPASVAVQTVSKQYVDAAVAAAATGVPVGSTTYLQRNGDAMTGALVLSGDPTTAPQAANKHYVDLQTTALTSGLSTKVSSLPGTAQTITQPDGTGLGVNVLNGEVYASQFANGPGSNGIANALNSSNCGHGCVVKAEPNYTANESVVIPAMPDFGHIVDERGGAEAHVFANPLGVDTGDLSAGSSWAQFATRSTPALKALRPSVFGQSSVTMNLANTAMAGGSNQFPASIETVPYGKNTYGVTTATGNYFTQGQHVQATNYINCFGVGDCLAGSLYITSSGGYRDEADEGAHPFDRQVLEDFRTFQGTCATGCTKGSTAVTVSATSAAGTQGDGRYLIDKNPAKVISNGTLQGGGRGVLGSASFAGTSFPVSVFLQTAGAAKSQATDMAPGTVTLAIATGSVPAGFATGTAALPATSGVACVADSEAAGSVFPNFETANYSVVDATHLRLSLTKVHATGAVVAVGGLCGYGLEQTVDTTNGVRQVFPVVGSVSATSLYYADALTTVVGLTNDVNTSGYQNVTLPIASVARSGGVVTVTLANAMTQDIDGLNVNVQGVADASFNGSATVRTTASTTLTFASAGADGTSSGGSVVLLTGGYALYPMAEVQSVFNPSTKGVDGLMTLAPNTVNWQAGDAVEEPHYYQQYTFGDTEYVKQYVPRTISYASSGKEYSGELGPGVRGWQISNAVPKTNYMGAGGTHRPPDDAHQVTGVWNNDFEVDAGVHAVLRIHCNLHGCNRWDSGYSVLEMDAANGEDFLFYDPNSSTAQFVMGGAAYSFSPGGLGAGTVNATTLNAGTLNASVVSTSGMRATGGTLNGVEIGTSVAARATVKRLDVLNTGADPGASYATMNLATTGTAGYGPSFLLDASSMGGHKYTVYASGPNDAGGAGLFAIYDNTAAAGRLSLGADGAVTIGGPVIVPQVLGSGGAPSAVVGSAAGTGGSVGVSGSAMAGVIALTTGSGTGTNATAVTLTFNGALAAAPQGCAVMPRSASGAAATGTVYTTAPTNRGWSLAVGAAALQAVTTYQWSYLCF